MLKLHQHFFINFLLIALLLLLITGLVSFYTLKNMELESVEETLSKNIVILENLLHHYQDTDRLVKKIGAESGIRITIVDMGGVVLAESDYEPSEMANHIDRPEIQMALKEGTGSSVRYSQTLNSDLLYVAKKSMIDSQELFIRAAESLQDVNEHFMILWVRITSIFVVAIFFAMVISFFLSKKVKNEIDNIQLMLGAIANKNYRFNKDTVSFVHEFTAIKSLIWQIGKRLSRRDKQKRKFEAKLRLKNRQQKDIISALSHEFKNPIAVIMGYSETLKKDPAMPEKIRMKFLEKIDKNAHRITSMLDRLTLMTKIENQEIGISESQFDLLESATEVKTLLEDKYTNRTIQVEGESRFVRADKTMIEMVMINLCENALKYSSDEVRLVIEKERVMVEDKGSGISEEEIENITKKFYRVEENTWDNSLGLGLSIVSYILKLHNSRLMITSRVGEGSTFFFYL